MVERKILLEKINDVKVLVETLSSYDYEIDVIQKRYTMNAKSILGIFSLDLTQPLLLRIHADSCDDLLKDIEQFIVKE